MLGDVGRMLVGLGLLLVAAGGALWVISHVPGGGRLPGDILIRRRGVTFYFPLATGLIVSVVLSLAATLLQRIFRR